MAPAATIQDAAVALPLDHPSLYLDRELSLLAFQKRALAWISANTAT